MAFKRVKYILKVRLKYLHLMRHFCRHHACPVTSNRISMTSRAKLHSIDIACTVGFVFIARMCCNYIIRHLQMLPPDSNAKRWLNSTSRLLANTARNAQVKTKDRPPSTAGLGWILVQSDLEKLPSQAYKSIFQGLLKVIVNCSNPDQCKGINPPPAAQSDARQGGRKSRGQRE